MTTFAAMFAVILLALSSCGGPKTPSDVVKKAIESIQEGEVEDYLSLMYYDGNEEAIKKTLADSCAAIEETYGMKVAKEELKIRGIYMKSYEILSEKIDESAKTAVVNMKMTIARGCDGLVETETRDKEVSVNLRMDSTGAWRIEDAYALLVAMVSYSTDDSDEVNDLAVFCLYGAVKEVKYEATIWIKQPELLSFICEHWGTAKFDNAGNLYNDTTQFKVQRDANGVLTKAYSDTFSLSCEYNYDGDISKSVEESFDKNSKKSDGMTQYVPYYDVGHILINCEKKTTSMLGSVRMTDIYTMRYTYTKFDSHGNWTERVVRERGSEGTEVRVITYYY